MNPKRRRLVLFLIFDALVVAGLAIWLFGRGRAEPVPQPRPPSAAQAIVPADTSPTVVPATPVEPAIDPAPQAALPEVAATLSECHGTWNGNPFWMRLSAPDPELKGNRRLQLVYTPPAPTEVGGAMIHDSPVLFVDGNLRVLQWDNRDGATGVMVDDPGYKVMREIHTEGSDQTALKTHKLKQRSGWDLRLAPLLAAMVWKPGVVWSVPVVDFWGTRAGERLDAHSDGKTVDVAGTLLTVRSAADGRVSEVVDAQGQPVVSITGWK